MHDNICFNIFIFVFMPTIIAPPRPAHTFSPSNIASSRLFQRRFGNIFIRDPILLTPVMPQNLLGESFGFTFFLIQYLSLTTIKLSFRQEIIKGRIQYCSKGILRDGRFSTWYNEAVFNEVVSLRRMAVLSSRAHERRSREKNKFLSF